MEGTETSGLEGNLGGAAPAPAGTAAPTAQETAPAMSPQEEIGFHKGALNTLVAERSELVKIIGNVDAIMQAHITRLKELGVDVTGGQQTGQTQPPQA